MLAVLVEKPVPRVATARGDDNRAVVLLRGPEEKLDRLRGVGADGDYADSRSEAGRQLRPHPLGGFGGESRVIEIEWRHNVGWLLLLYFAQEYVDSKIPSWLSYDKEGKLGPRRQLSHFCVSYRLDKAETSL